MKWPNYLDARVTTPVLKSHFHTLEQLLLLPEQPSQKETHLPWQRCNSCQQLLPLSLSGAEGHWGREHLHSLSQGCWALPTARNSRMQEGQSSKGLSGPGKGWAQLVAEAAQRGGRYRGVSSQSPHTRVVAGDSTPKATWPLELWMCSRRDGSHFPALF